jgi:hypothetical protein
MATATKPKIWPRYARFFECGVCGSLHAAGTPWWVDCRDDSRRFTIEELDSHYGADQWREVEVEEEEAGV